MSHWWIGPKYCIAGVVCVCANHKHLPPPHAFMKASITQIINLKSARVSEY